MIVAVFVLACLVFVLSGGGFLLLAEHESVALWLVAASAVCVFVLCVACLALGVAHFGGSC